MMRNENDNALHVAVIGNGPQADLLSTLLNIKGNIVTRFRSTDMYSGDFPYYPNDLTSGIMKKLITDTDISINYCKRIKGFHFEKDDMIFEVPDDFEEFKQYLYDQYPEEKEKLQIFMKDVQIIGEEWLHYIESSFTDASCMKYSGRFFGLTLEDALSKYEICTPLISTLFQLILPKDGVMFNVFCGYLYTQFFDVCAVDESVFNIVYKQQENVFVSSLEKVLISKQSECGIYDIVVDYRQSGKPDNLNENNSVVMGSFKVKECRLDPNIEYVVYESLDKCTVRLWNDNLLKLHGSNDKWNFELICIKELLPDELRNVKEWLENYIGGSCDLFTYSSNDEIDLYFDTKNANGYEWAFDKVHTMIDPTNLVRRHRKSCLNLHYWGFAWLSAAYHAANVVINQMKYDEGKYDIQ